MMLEEFAKAAAPNTVERADHITEVVVNGNGVKNMMKWTAHENFMELFDGSLFQPHEIGYIEKYSLRS